MPDFELAVHDSFGKWQRGDIIEDAAEIEAIMASEHSSRVTRRAALHVSEPKPANDEEHS